MDESFSYRKSQVWTKLLVVAVAAISVAAYLMLQQKEEVSDFKKSLLKEGLEYCRKAHEHVEQIDTKSRTENPRYKLFTTNDKTTLIKSATIIDGDGAVNLTKHDIFVDKGIITAVVLSGSSDSEGLKQSFGNIEVIDAEGFYVSPGLVDMHSHVGICTQPELKGVNDMFELMHPVTPFTRVIDAFNVGDPAVQMAAKGGVTSALVLPSANLISGEGFAMKMSVPPSLSAEEMMVQYSPESPFEDIERQRWMKMACGENPKKRFTSIPDAPKTRMGLGHVFRETIQQAQKLKQSQDLWCEDAANGQLPELGFPRDDNLDLLVDLLRGKIMTNVHCYETFDIETILRHAREFGIEINALHHALDAYRIPKIIKSQPYNITMATFSSAWGFKKEAFQASLFAPKILEQNNISVVLTTDHPAIPGHTLINEAQIAHHFGLSAEKAFASISGESARALRLGDRIGFLRKGYDADIIIWNKHPLLLGSKPLKVFIDGNQVVDSELLDGELNDAPSSIKEGNDEITSLYPLEGANTYLIKGITDSIFKGLTKLLDSIFELYVENKKVVCFQQDCSKFYNQNVPIIKVKNGVISPLLSIVNPGLGMVEMDGEPMTGDGILVRALEEKTLLDFKDPNNVIQAKNGLQLGGMHLIKAFNLGVGKVITPPFRGEGNVFVTGVSVAFWANGDNLDCIVKDEVALHITVGDAGKQAGVPTISSQISVLQRLLTENKDQDNIYGKVARSEIPLAVHTQNKDVMLHLIRLKNDYDINLVIVGGIESHLIADQLASNQIPVIVTPWQCQRKYWDERRCITGLAGEKTVIEVLYRAGVKVGVGIDQDEKVRVVLQNAGLAAELSGIPPEQMMKMLTENIEEILSLPKTDGSTFFISEGSPLAYGLRIEIIIQDGIVQKIHPEIEPQINVLIE